MTRTNWHQKYPAEVYENLFRFRKEDIETLIATLKIPALLKFDTGHYTNRLDKSLNICRLIVLHHYSHEAIHIVLRRLCFPNRWIDLSFEFDLRYIFLFLCEIIRSVQA